MSGDYSRQRFNPWNDFSAVLAQQGRVQLDSDSNELMEILDRRWRAETIDIIGRCIVPKETPDGFKITPSGGAFTIGRGRMYVDGLLAENHGMGDLEFDPALAELRGKDPRLYDQQPYYPNPDPLPQGGPYLVYIDAWQREATFVELPDLIENAVGVDTTARLQTVWQVKALPVASDVICETPDDQISNWIDIIQPSAGRLTTGAETVPDLNDLCLVPPTGGYRGLENQLYRVEIHDKGPLGTATFKWSRDNASVVTSVTAITALNTLKVARTGRDSVLRFNTDDWVEITDDVREFAGKAGFMRKILTVDDATRTITLAEDLPSGEFPVDAEGNVDPNRHTRVRRWDQRGVIRDKDGNTVFDLDAPPAPGTTAGVIPVPTGNVTLILENGVGIAFDTQPTNGDFRVGDYWVCAARAGDGVEELNQAPPRGIHHHYCRLAVVTSTGASDCRHLWPPDLTAEGCECSVCVTPESHNSGAVTIAWAIDQVKDQGGTVCLGPGNYLLREPLLIDGAKSVHLKGHGGKTVLAQTGSGSGVIIRNCVGFTIEELAVVTSAAAAGQNPTMEVSNSAGITIRHCEIVQLDRSKTGSAGIGASGALVSTVIRDNLIFASTGLGNIGTLSPTGGTTLKPLLTAGLYVENNLIDCIHRGISLEEVSAHSLETRLSGNFFDGCSDAAIVVLGGVTPGCGIDIHENEIHAGGSGIVAGTDGVRVTVNDISALANTAGGDGIVIAPGLDASGVDRCQVLANRINGVTGFGIAIRASLHSAMFKDNVINGAGAGGIVMSEDAKSDDLKIENNQLLNVAPQANDPKKPVSGIRVVNTRHAEIGDNTLSGVGSAAVQSLRRTGIQVVASGWVRVAGNHIVDLGPSANFAGDSVGIELLGTFERLDVAGNVIRRSSKPPQAPDTSDWYAIRIRSGAPPPAVGGAEARVVTVVDTKLELISAGELSFAFLGSKAVKIDRAREIVSLRGNMTDSYGDVSGLNSFIRGAFVLTDNQFLLDSQKIPAVADVQAGSVIASSNFVRGPRKAPAMSLNVPQGAPFTVVGNIANEKIQVNGSPLATPWEPLNIIVP